MIFMYVLLSWEFGPSFSLCRICIYFLIFVWKKKQTSTIDSPNYQSTQQLMETKCLFVAPTEAADSGQILGGPEMGQPVWLTGNYCQTHTIRQRLSFQDEVFTHKRARNQFHDGFQKCFKEGQAFGEELRRETQKLGLCICESVGSDLWWWLSVCVCVCVWVCVWVCVSVWVCVCVCVCGRGEPTHKRKLLDRFRGSPAPLRPAQQQELVITDPSNAEQDVLSSLVTPTCESRSLALQRSQVHLDLRMSFNFR